MDLTWTSVDRFDLAGVSFVATPSERFRSDASAFLLVKPRWLIERHLALLEELAPRRVVELGIYQGGSTAFLALAARPDRLVAIELSDQPVGPLEALIDDHGLRGDVTTHYGVDQADGTRLRDIRARAFGEAPLDLVVDDASHRLEPTLRSFEVLFPHLRPGGVYVIEDWSGLHEYEQELEARIREDPALGERIASELEAGRVPDRPLTVMVFQAVLATAFSPDAIARIDVSKGWCAITRGPATIPPDGFSLRATYSDTAARLIG